MVLNSHKHVPPFSPLRGSKNAERKDQELKET